MMSQRKLFGITVAVNLGIFLCYFGLVYFGSNGSTGPYTPDLAEVFFTSIGHFLLLLVACVISLFFKDVRGLSQGLGLSALLILILGFSSCFG